MHCEDANADGVFSVAPGERQKANCHSHRQTFSNPTKYPIPNPGPGPHPGSD